MIGNYDYGIIDFQGTPYDYSSLMHYSGDELFRKSNKYKDLGCYMGRPYHRNPDMSVLDVQEINTKYQCGKGYSKVGECADYLNEM